MTRSGVGGSTRGGSEDDVGGSEVTTAGPFPTIESPNAADVNGTNDDVDDAPLEVEENVERCSPLLGAPRFFHSATRVNGIVPSILHPSRLR